MTEAELRERGEREPRAKEEGLKVEFTAFVERMRKEILILDIFFVLWYNMRVIFRREYVKELYYKKKFITLIDCTCSNIRYGTDFM